MIGPWRRPVTGTRPPRRCAPNDGITRAASRSYLCRRRGPRTLGLRSRALGAGHVAMTGRGSSQTRSVASPDDETLRERELLAPYLARPVIEWAENSPELRHRSVEATVAFVDISGFTKLSEGLAKHGKIGAEELAATIGNCFVELLDLAYANGGRLIKFGGDALLLSFIGPDHAARGCRAAFEMRLALRTVGRLTVLGQHVQLRMSVG